MATLLPEEKIILGIDLGGTKIYGAAARQEGEILHEVYSTHHQARAEASLAVVCGVLDQLIAYTQSKGLAVCGAGIGVPGVVQSETGVVSLAPALDWNAFPLQARLAARYPFPLAIENDVNLAALGEVWFGGAPRVHNLVLVALGTGIGAGIVIDDAIYHGAHHLAGEVGYFLPGRDHLGQPYPDFGALEQLTSGTGIAARGRAAWRAAHPEAERPTLSTEEVFAAARRGEAWAESILRDSVDYLALLVAAITLIIDPDVIRFSGGVAQSADLLLDPILKRLEGAIPIRPNLQVSRLGTRAAALGAIIQVQRLFSNAG